MGLSKEMKKKTAGSGTRAFQNNPCLTPIAMGTEYKIKELHQPVEESELVSDSLCHSFKVIFL